jgi:hypothetical protein
MFGQRYRYYEAPDGRRFCWNVEPTFVCPLAWFERTDDEAKARIATPAVEAAAAALGCGIAELLRMLERQHRSFTNTRRRDAGGKLTNTCDCCGSRMQREGFRVWVEQPKRELSETDRVSAAISKRLGGDGVQTETLRSFYLETKREATDWALDELRTAQSAAREEAKAK